jgi:hypothetical protein
MATSVDGKTWTGIGSAVLDASGLDATWNGTAWLAVGSGSSHTMAYTTVANGSSGWVGLGKSTFTDRANGVDWMMGKWVVAGKGGNTLAYSTVANASSGWTGLGTSVFSSSGNGVRWNGKIAVAVGEGGNTIATSTNVTSWSGQGTSVLGTRGNAVEWNGMRWVATGVGANNVVYGTDGTTWNATTGIGGGMDAGLCIGANSRVGIETVGGAVYLATTDKWTMTTPAYYDDGLSPDTSVSFGLNIPA